MMMVKRFSVEDYLVAASSSIITPNEELIFVDWAVSEIVALVTLSVLDPSSRVHTFYNQTTK